MRNWLQFCVPIRKKSCEPRLWSSNRGVIGSESLLHRKMALARTVTLHNTCDLGAKPPMYDIPHDLLDAFRATPAILTGLLAGCDDARARTARGGDENWSVT